VLISEVLDLDDIATLLNGVAAQNHWPPERTSAMMGHMREEHLGETQVGEMATRAQVKSVVLYHYAPAKPAVYVAKVKEHFSGPVFAAVDLDRYCLESTEASGKSGSILRKCDGSPESRATTSHDPR
jgi:hypothetical protein